MIKLIKDKAFAIRGFWSWYIYWIPTIMTEFHPKEKSCLTSIYIDNTGNPYNGHGSALTFTIYIFVWQVTIDFWWNLTSKNYGSDVTL